MSHQVSIDCGGLKAHAAQVEQVARSLDQPIDAITYMTVGSDAYGLMCSFAAMPTNLVGAGAGAALVATRGLLERIADAARQVADDFELAEQEYCSQINQLESELDGTVYV